MKKFKKITDKNPINPILTNFSLIQAMELKKGKKKCLGENYTVYLLLSNFIEPYGITLRHKTWIYTLNDEPTDIEVNAIIIDKNIPLQNLIIIYQLYGYKNAKVNISIEFTEEHSDSFILNLNTKQIMLNRHHLSSVIKSKRFDSMEELFRTIQICKGNMDKVFEYSYEFQNQS